MPASSISSSVDADEGGGAGSDDDSGMRPRVSSSDLRWSRMTEGTKGWRLRGVEWRVKLGILPGGSASVDAMRRATADERRRYADLRRRLLVDPHIMDDDDTPHPRMDNPLSLDPESVWGRYFRNAELEKTIDKDLTRLYPELGVFFQSDPCQAMMRRILLVWSLIHPQFSYRQGMHELLGPLLYVLHVDVVRLSQVKHRFEDLFDDRFDSLSLQEQHVRDKVELAKSFCGEMVVAGDSINFNESVRTCKDVTPDPEEERVDLSVIIQGSDMYGVEGELGALLSARFLEHDAYCMLDALLVGRGGAVAMAEYFSSPVVGGKPPVIEASAALYRTLAAADMSLYTHLVDLGVEPQFFALRWLRLLFGREFFLEDLLRVWDAIFEADNTSLYLHGDESSELKFSHRSALIFSFCVSMLLYVRPALLAAPDATACLQRLLNFPQVPDVRDLIESAKSLLLLAKAAAKTPGPPVPRNVRSSESRGSGKHSRSGSISPPSSQHLVLFHQNASSQSPESLRISMSLPGSYWEEKWTLSVLHKKTPDELFSPRGRTESALRGFDYPEREAAGIPGTLSRSGSGTRYQTPGAEPNAANFTNRTYDTSPDSGDEDGQEMARRDGSAAVQTAVSEDFCSHLQPSESKNCGSTHPIENEEADHRQIPGLDLGLVLDSSIGQRRIPGLNLGDDDSSMTLGADQERRQPRELDLGDSSIDSSTDNEPMSNEKFVRSDPFLSEGHDSVMIGCSIGVCTKIGCDEAYRHSTVDRDEIFQSANSVTGHNDSGVAQYANVSGSRLASDEFSFATQTQPATCESALISSPGEILDSSRKEKSVHVLGTSSNAEQDIDLPLNIGADPQMLPGTSSSSDDISNAEVSGMSQDEACKCDSESLSVSSDTKVEVKDLEKGESKSRESLFPPSKSKPPLPPSRLGRFNWVWSLGRTSIAEKTGNTKTSKEELLDCELPPNSSGTVSDADASSSAGTNTAQRKKKSWWRSNSDVVPEDCLESHGSDSTSSSDCCANDLGHCEEEKACPEPGVVIAPEVTSKEEAKAETLVQCQETLKKPKESNPSAALHALGLSMLEHVQVLESSLAQKVSVLGLEQMWTAAVREKSDNVHSSALGSKGQGAALMAIAELRKISQLLQQM